MGVSRVAGPESRGARIVKQAELEDLLDARALQSAHQGIVGALLLVRLERAQGGALSGHEMIQAGYVLAQVARGRDALAHVDGRTIGIVVSHLARRSDVHVLLERIENCVSAAGHTWCISAGVGVFPMCGPKGSDAWNAACRDLEGASSSDSWVHEVPRDTLRTHEAC